MNRLLPLAALLLLLTGCASQRGAPTSLYDFGALPPAAGDAAPRMPPLVIADVSGPAALDTQSMYYRLSYADPLQARPYANNRWNSTPLQMLTQRFKARTAQAGVKVLALTDASSNSLLLRVEVDDFSHTFDSATQNYGQVLLRASLFQGHRLIDQKSFDRKVTSTSADAAGGARALAAASDAIAADMLAWIGTLPLPKE
ncbi:MAG: ABC-type transport auxiliary lipoprotein family protein [Pseudomonadota bacterium]